jgi:hypothetical protein
MIKKVPASRDFRQFVCSIKSSFEDCLKRSAFSSHRFLVATSLALVLVYVASAQLRRGGGWVSLGNAHVDGNTDHDRINVVYGNHHTEAMPFRVRVAPGGSRRLTLPDGPRDIA